MLRHIILLPSDFVLDAGNIIFEIIIPTRGNIIGRLLFSSSSYVLLLSYTPSNSEPTPSGEESASPAQFLKSKSGMAFCCAAILLMRSIT